MSGNGTDYVHPQPICMVCKAERPAMATCRYCLGTGSMLRVGWAPEPWTEIVPNLWVGGHIYDPDIWGSGIEISSKMLADAGFEVVVSLYQDECHPEQHVRHLWTVVPDDIRKGLWEEEINAIYYLSERVVESVTEGKKTLVRCQAGLNRANLTAGLALIQMGHQPQEAIDMIRAKRAPHALFNERFVEILMAQSPPAEESA